MLHSKKAPSQPDANDAKSSNSEAAVWNRKAALDALDNDAEVFKSLVQVLADELNERLAALDAALTVGDEEQLRRTAHACKIRQASCDWTNCVRLPQKQNLLIPAVARSRSRVAQGDY